MTSCDPPTLRGLCLAMKVFSIIDLIPQES
jgi:hypothetical protein